MASISLEQIITFLLDAPMFGDLDPAQLSEIVHIMQIRRVRAGQAVFQEGDPGDAWYVVYDGEVDVTKGDDFQAAKVIAQIGPRGCFGEMAILDHSPRSAGVVARNDATVFRFPRSDFEALLHADNLAAYKLVYEMAKVLSVRARNTTQRLSEALAAHEAPDRLRSTTTAVVEHQSISE
jgi:CRP-like cAMP-binding protein